MPEVGDVKTVWLSDKVEMDFCWIPPGDFRMGSRDGYPSEQPVHRFRIEQGFWLARTPVTQQHYALRFPGTENGFPNNPNHPAESMSWHDARRFCRWLTERSLSAAEWQGWLADLPTEAQWEYACRAGTDTDYCTGDGEQALARAGWYSGNSQGTTREVWQPGKPAQSFKQPNAFGLYDIHGNVWEWCRDRWAEDAYRYCPDGRVEPVSAGENARDTDDGARVVRGGSWGNHADICRSASRNGYVPGFRNLFRGFRVGLFPGPSCPGPEAG